MTISDLGDLGDFLGGIGVFATLVYLAIQVRRNTRAVKSASLDSAYAAHMEFQRTVWSDPELNKFWFTCLFCKSELSEEDEQQFFFMLNSCARLWERVYVKAQEGSLESGSWVGLNQELIDVFSCPGAIPVWGSISPFCSPEFVEHVERSVQHDSGQGDVDASQAQATEN